MWWLSLGRSECGQCLFCRVGPACSGTKACSVTHNSSHPGITLLQGHVWGDTLTTNKNI